MKFSRCLNRCVGVLLTLALVGVPQVLAAGSSLNGSIMRGSDHTPMVGARLHVANPRTGEMFSSAPATREGGFAVSGLPAASYALAVEHSGGLYMVESALMVSKDSTQTLNLAVSPRSNSEQANFEKSDDGKKGGLFKRLDNPLMGTLIGLGAAVLIGVAIGGSSDSDPPASPSQTD